MRFLPLLWMICWFAPAKMKAQLNPLIAVKADSLRIDSLQKAAWKIAISDPPKSLRVLQTAEAIQLEKGTTYKQDVQFYYYGIVYKNLGRYTESENYLNRYEKLALDKKRIDKLATVSIAKANLYSDQGYWDKSMLACTSGLRYSEELKDTARIIIALGKLGYLLSEMNRPRDALDYHHRSLIMSRAITDSSQQSIC